MFSFHVNFCVLILGFCGLFLVVSAVDSSSTEAASSESSSTSTSSTPTSTTTTTTTTTTSSTLLKKCDELSVMENINIFAISGTWYEFARKGYGTYVQDLQCLQMDITYMDGTAMVYQTYATGLETVNNQTTYEYTVQYNKTNPSSYKIVSTTYIWLPTPVYKILDTDYQNYLVVCSYLPVWPESAAAFVYFRNRDTPDIEVYAIVSQTARKYVDFYGLNLEYQGAKCHSGVLRRLPMGAMIYGVLLIYALKLIK